MKNQESLHKAKVTDAFVQYSQKPTYENHSKFMLELAKISIKLSYNSEKEKEIAKDWTELGYELFVSKDYDKAKSIIVKLSLSLSSIK